MQEIKEIIKDMRNNAAPGPDGLNASFYKATWDLIGKDTVESVQNNYRTGHMPYQINNTFLALIQKINNPATPRDYRPISLCNVIYKIIAKSLANRLKQCLPSTILPNQSACLKGRHIATNVILA